MARSAVMTTAQRLTWLAGFANDDLQGLREGDWLNLQDDLSRFLGPHASGLVGVPDPETAPPTAGAVRNLQGATREVLSVVSGGPRGVRSTLIRTAIAWEPSGDGAVAIRSRGSLKDVFLTQLLFLLLEGGADRMLRCPAPECGRFFWKSRRQKYCSQRCTNRAIFRAWLKTAKGKTRSKREAKAARERRRYKRMLAERRKAGARRGAAGTPRRA